MRVAVERELRGAHAARLRRDSFFRRIVVEGEPVFRLELQADLAGLAGVVVDRDGQRDLVALGERDRQIEIHEEVLKHFQAGSRGAECAGGSGGQHGHAPGGDGVGDRDRDIGVALRVGDDLGIDVERFRKVGANMRRSLLHDRLERHGKPAPLHGLDKLCLFHRAGVQRVCHPYAARQAAHYTSRRCHHQCLSWRRRFHHDRLSYAAHFQCGAEYCAVAFLKCELVREVQESRR